MKSAVWTRAHHQVCVGGGERAPKHSLLGGECGGLGARELGVLVWTPMGRALVLGASAHLPANLVVACAANLKARNELSASSATDERCSERLIDRSDLVVRIL